MTKTQKKPKDSNQAKPRASSADIKSGKPDNVKHLELLAASILPGLISGSNNRAEELVEQAFQYAEMIIKYKK